MKTPNGNGFTLIELLVVIAIIGILSSTVLVSMKGVREKARDAQKMNNLKNYSTALMMYYDTYGKMPDNFNPGLAAQEGENGVNPGPYEESMQELVDAGLISSIPKSPSGQIWDYYDYGPGGAGYGYYDYGPNNSIGALLVVTLENAPDSVNGIPPSCRPFDARANWCDQSSNKYYCLCSPY